MQAHLSLLVAIPQLGNCHEWKPNNCIQQKIKEIYLGTRAIFLAAQQFYKKNGFKEISKVNLPDTFPLNLVDSKFYIRCL